MTNKFAELIKQERGTVKVRFLGTNVDVLKLNVEEIEAFQDKVSKLKEEEKNGLALQRDIIRMGVVGADEMTDKELNQFPQDDLSRLAKEVLRLGGIADDEGK